MKLLRKDLFEQISKVKLNWDGETEIWNIRKAYLRAFSLRSLNNSPNHIEG